MSTGLNYSHTRMACYIAYFIQAAVCNLPPLLFVTFQNEFGVSIELLAMLISLNFGTQLLTDLVFAKLADKLGFRVCAVLSHALAFLGLLFYFFLPYTLDNAYLGLVISVMTSAVGSGLAEVIISPIIESIPGKHKSAKMSMLHAMYCWGHVGVVIIATLYFAVFGTENWKYLFLVCSFIPLMNLFFFLRVPLGTLVDQEKQEPAGALLRRGMFWLLMLIMVCAGASELAMAQWSSMFAEKGLQVSKTMGDLLGTLTFAVLMGTSRTIYGVYGKRIPLEKAMLLSGLLCIVSYMMAGLFKNPVIALMGCGLCGFSVGLMWPGAISLAAKRFPAAGAALFAYLAVGGDIGCTLGPSLTGVISGAAQRMGYGDASMKIGLLTAIIFPVLLMAGLWILHKSKEENKV